MNKPTKAIPQVTNDAVLGQNAACGLVGKRART